MPVLVVPLVGIFGGSWNGLGFVSASCCSTAGDCPIASCSGYHAAPGRWSSSAILCALQVQLPQPVPGIGSLLPPIGPPCVTHVVLYGGDHSSHRLPAPGCDIPPEQAS